MAAQEEVAKLILVFEAQMKGLQTGLTKSKGQFDKFSTGMKKSVEGLRKNWLGLTIAIGGTVLALKRGFDTFSNFNQKMREVFTLLDIGEEQFAGLTAEVLELTKKLPQSADELATSLYGIVSAGVDVAEAMKVLELSAKAAVGGVTNVKTASEAGLAVMNAYGQSTDDLAGIFDVLQLTVKTGVTTMNELSGSLGQVLSTARIANVDFKTVAASIATLTKAGIKTPRAMTALRAAMFALVSPTEAAAKVMEKMEITSKGFIPILQEIARRNLDLEEFRPLIPDIEAIKGIATLTSNMGVLEQTMLGMDDASGAMVEAFDKMKDTPENKMKLFANGVDRLKIAFAGVLATQIVPVFEDITKEIDKMIKSGAFKTLAEQIAAFAKEFLRVGQWVIKNWPIIAGFGIAIVVGKIAASLLQMSLALKALAVALVATPVGLAITLIAAFGGAVAVSAIKLKQMNDELKEYKNGMKGVVEITRLNREQTDALNSANIAYLDFLKRVPLAAKDASKLTTEEQQKVIKGFKEQGQAVELAEAKLKSLSIELKGTTIERFKEIQKLLGEKGFLFTIPTGQTKKETDPDKPAAKKAAVPGAPSSSEIERAKADLQDYSNFVKIALAELDIRYAENKNAVTEYFDAIRPLFTTLGQQQLELLELTLEAEKKVEQQKRIDLQNEKDLEKQAGKTKAVQDSINKQKEIENQIRQKKADLQLQSIKLNEDEKKSLEDLAKSQAIVNRTLEEAQKRIKPETTKARHAAELSALQDSQDKELTLIKKQTDDINKIEAFGIAHRQQQDQLAAQQRTENINAYANNLKEVASQITGIFNNIAQVRINDLENEKQKEIETVQSSINEKDKEIAVIKRSSLSSEQQKKAIEEITIAREEQEKQIEAINDKADAAIIKQKKKQQNLALLDIAVNTAVAVMKLWADLGPLALAIIPLVIAAGLTQAAVVKSQKYGKGGAIEGPAHSSGGVDIEAEGGEYMHSRKATSYYGPGIMEALNQRRVPKGLLADFSGYSAKKPQGMFQTGGLVTGAGGNGGFRIVNFVDQTLFDRYLRTPEGRESVMNVINERSAEVKRIVS